MKERAIFDAGENVERTGFGRPGFAEQYQAVRPRLPTALVDLLTQYAHCDRPRLVADLGCGTGLSTQPWIERAEFVVGIEPLDAMLTVARTSVQAENLEWRRAFAHETGLPDGSVDIAVCSQSFHWMEPQPTLREVARILRPGGVFATIDCDMPAIDGEVETAALQFSTRARMRREELGIAVGADQGQAWPKEGHLAELRNSGWFEYVREVVIHNVETVSAERFVEETINIVVDFLPELRAVGVRDEEIGLDAFRRVASLRMGSSGRWFTGYRIRLGIRKEH